MSEGARNISAALGPPVVDVGSLLPWQLTIGSPFRNPTVHLRL